MKAKELLGKDVIVNSMSSYWYNRIGRVVRLDEKDEKKVLVHFMCANYFIKFSVDKLTLWSSFIKGGEVNV